MLGAIPRHDTEAGLEFPDIPQPINFFEGWQEVPDATVYDNAFKIQWELFLRHVALANPSPTTS